MKWRELVSEQSQSGQSVAAFCNERGALGLAVLRVEEAAPEIAREAAEMVGALFGVGKEARDVSVAERLQLRLTRSAPVLAVFAKSFFYRKSNCCPSIPWRRR
jgi:hypothetical protein